jgi:flagellar hook-basal body complex protein FliE
MISCLEYDLEKKIDIICMQESWIGSNQITIFHSTFNRILLEQKQNETHKQRIVTFVFKKFIFFVTSRSNLCSNTDIQIFNISKTNIENFIVLNVYNEKNQKSSSEEYTIERKLTTIDLTKNSIICEDFNVHYQWWNSRITSSIRAKTLIDWLNKFNCELINISDEYTFTRENSNSVIDLTFATIDLASKITNWSINDDAKIDSDHEIIEFSINVENIETVNNSMTKKFNTQKANGNKFSEYFKNNHSSIKNWMSKLLNNSCQENLNEDAKLLRDVIIEASNLFISKKRSCENSKVWWTDELTQLRKNLAKAKRMYKALSNEENLSIFTRNRNDYFQAIRFAKKEFWSNFLNNAIEKKIFQAYKFIKNNRIKKLSSIQYEKKTNIEFENKCNAFIEAMYSISSNVENTSNETKIRLKLNSDLFEWSNLIESELRKAIFISASNKASKSDQLIFLIVQKAYNSISNIFFMLYSELINRDHHFVCWREEIEAILKKSNKSNYTASKAYRIITLLNCLEKSLRENNRFASVVLRTDIWSAWFKSDEWTKEFINNWRSHEFNTWYRIIT